MSSVKHTQKEYETAANYFKQKAKLGFVMDSARGLSYECAVQAFEELALLKSILFTSARKELDEFLALDKAGASDAESALQCARFCSVFQVIEDAELDEEYARWKESFNENVSKTA